MYADTYEDGPLDTSDYKNRLSYGNITFILRRCYYFQ